MSRCSPLRGVNQLFQKRYSSGIQFSQLSNQMRVATESIPGQTACLAVFVNTGSGYENESNNGVAHFLEHLAFKGTQARTRVGLEIEVENMGASLNAYTSREHTVYFIKAFKNDVPHALELLSDIVQHSKYNTSDIEYERQVVLREMEEVNKKVEELAMDQLHALAFDGSSLGYTILGPESNIQSFDRKQIVEYVRTHYCADRLLVVGVGAVEHDHLTNLVESHFRDVNPSQGEIVECAKPKFIGGAKCVEEDVDKDNYCVVAYEGAPWSSADMIPLLIVQTLIGNYDKSLGVGNNLAARLAQVMAQHNVCEKFSSFITSYNSTGLVGVSFSVKGRTSVDDALQEVMSEYVRLAHNVGRDEVERAKSRVKASLALSFDGFTPRCEDIGRQLLTIGRRVPLEEYFERIDSIDESRVRDVCIRRFVDTKPAVIAVGKRDRISLPDYEQICSWTKW